MSYMARKNSMQSTSRNVDFFEIKTLYINGFKRVII